MKNDKFIASEMRLIKEIPTKEVVVEFAIKCAERSLKNFERWNKEEKEHSFNLRIGRY